MDAEAFLPADSPNAALCNQELRRDLHPAHVARPLCRASTSLPALPRRSAALLRHHGECLCIAPRHRNPITAWFRVATRCLGCPEPSSRHPTVRLCAVCRPIAKARAIGPGLILFREDLHILSGNCASEPRSYGFATKRRGGRGNMKACGRASFRLQKSGYLSIQAVFASAHFVRVNNGVVWLGPSRLSVLHDTHSVAIATNSNVRAIFSVASK